MLIPGFLIGLITFPGVIVHELGHLVMCRLANVKVFEWCLFRLKNPMGFVVHEKPDSLFKSFLVTFGPFFINSISTALLIVAGGLVSYIFPFGGIFFLWLAISVGAHAFPSFADGKNLLAHTQESIEEGRYLSVFYLPFVGLIYLGGALKFFWIDFIYSLLIIALTLGFFGLPLFYNVYESPTVEIVSGKAQIIGCKLSLDGAFLGETSEEQLSVKLPKELVESKEEHVIKCEFVGCRDWKIDTEKLKNSPVTIELDWDNANFVDCETNEQLNNEQIEIYKKFEEQFTITQKEGGK